jgi:hypothetical protein
VVAHGALSARALAVVASAIAAVVGLGGCSLLPPDPGPPRIENAPLARSDGWVDTCVVGTWRLVRGTTSLDLGDGTIDLTTTGDRVFTASADGRLEITFPGQGLHWNGTNGTDTVEGFVTGAASGTYTAEMGEWSTVVDNSATLTKVSLNGVAEPPEAGGRDDTGTSAYFCSEDELVITSEAARMVYTRA